MAQSGNWVGNLINWFIGYILLGLWYMVGALFSIVGMWQMGADGALGVIADWKPSDVGTTYEGSLTIGN